MNGLKSATKRAEKVQDLAKSAEEPDTINLKGYLFLIHIDDCFIFLNPVHSKDYYLILKLDYLHFHLGGLVHYFDYYQACTSKRLLFDAINGHDCHDFI